VKAGAAGRAHVSNAMLRFTHRLLLRVVLSLGSLLMAMAISLSPAAAAARGATATATARHGAPAGRKRSSPPVLRSITEIELPGPAVRFDYQSLDTAANRLYISHMNAGEVVVFDVKSRRVIATIGDLPRVTGVRAVPDLGKVYASVTGRHEVAVIDGRRLSVLGRLGEIGFPDGIAYVPDVKKIYVSDESGGGELVIDGNSDRAVATIPLGGEAGNSIYDPGSGRVLVAVQTRNEVVTIDPASDRVAGRFRLAGAAHPHGLSIDVQRRLLFVANENNATLLTVDLRTMRVIGAQRVGEEPDVLAFDPGWRRLYVACESGVVSVFREADGHLAGAGQVRIPHAHSVAVDPRTHLVYLPLQDVGGRPVLRILRGEENASSPPRSRGDP